MGGLNYSKWDNIELSDDSDIEVHPNVDKKSFIRWKQRDIHENREMRRVRRSQLEAEKRTNADAAPVIVQVRDKTQSEGIEYFTREVARLSAGRAERGNKDGPDGPTLDDICLSLFLQVSEDERVKGASSSDRADRIVDVLSWHLGRIDERQKQIDDELAEMDKEDKKKITTDDVREAWSSGGVTHEEKTEEAPRAKTVQTIETLNSPKPEMSPDSDAEEEAPEANELMKQFAALPSALGGVALSTTALPPNAAGLLRVEAFEQARLFLGKHKELLRESYGTTDALMMEAFQAEMSGKREFARQCIEKGLLVQYCTRLGRDGVSLFFQRIVHADGRALMMYINDVLQTYARVASRSADLASKNEPEEQIQLMTEDPSMAVSFNIPDGPPPETITLEGEGTEDLDPEEVRTWLQRRWDIWQEFDPAFRAALESQDLDRVNAVLGKMPVPDAEKVVVQLQEGGILSFRSTEIQDETK
ncbi:hsp90 co-chaperone Cdc37 [Malassezia cuniculi]|uniref:Hsp90 chaperone protein kinase-targeting subunit n=1 Tax=Malassezia cuniculi TaxID=948313 RepID=A0AAF0ETU4_9BASI|nr:hsp90 co-chaperone Cdc37 [Malassezia cuniculi]